jgi:DNA-binding winged helix-turn-helix (wHTH) protein
LTGESFELPKHPPVVSLEAGLIIRFGEFRLDLVRRQLFQHDRDVHLTPKAFELLMILVNEHPRAMSKEDLYTRLWPSTFVVEANLSVLVAELRAALGDSPKQGSYIRTAHGYGYAFVADTIVEGATDARRVPYWLISATIQVHLHEGENVIGRDPNATVWLDATQVSRQHARIWIEGERAMLEDMGSKNGTWVRGELVSGPVLLVDGDVIRFGSSAEVTFRVGFDGGSTATDAG